MIDYMQLWFQLKVWAFLLTAGFVIFVVCMAAVYSFMKWLTRPKRRKPYPAVMARAHTHYYPFRGRGQ